MTAILNLTRNLQKTLKYREDHPIPPPPKIRHDPLPMLRIPLRNGYFEAKQCTVPCNYHPGDFIHGAKVNAVLAVHERVSLTFPVFYVLRQNFGRIQVVLHI